MVPKSNAPHLKPQTSSLFLLALQKLHSMRKTIIAIILFLSGFGLFAQNFDNLHFGTDSTLEVMTWNIEWFPKNGQTTVNYVSQIIEALDVDVIALQEIDSKYQFNQMLSGLTGWEGYYVDDDYSGLAYIYKTQFVDPYDIREIYESYNREFPRAPSVMSMRFNGVDFILINNHLKCCGDGSLNPNDDWDEEKRRLDACILLEKYISEEHPNDRVILLGDLNDVLIDEPSDNVFAPFMDKPNKYEFTDMAIAQGSSSDWSYPNWPSHLDHIMISDELFYVFWDEDSEIKTIKLDDYFNGGMNQYDEDVSDHRPVAIKFKVPEAFGLTENLMDNSLMKVYPNPFQGSTNIQITVKLSDSRIEVYNPIGIKVDDIILQNDLNLSWNADDLPPGMYIIKLLSGQTTISLRKVVLR
jgi:endonuclease/exonuclease/phosphatase family metal-dependent hydrolase